MIDFDWTRSCWKLSAWKEMVLWQVKHQVKLNHSDWARISNPSLQLKLCTLTLQTVPCESLSWDYSAVQLTLYTWQFSGFTVLLPFLETPLMCFVWFLLPLQIFAQGSELFGQTLLILQAQKHFSCSSTHVGQSVSLRTSKQKDGQFRGLSVRIATHGRQWHATKDIVNRHFTFHKEPEKAPIDFCDAFTFLSLSTCSNIHKSIPKNHTSK